jgi:hypothetical protein
LNIIEQEVVAMIFRPTSTIPKEDVVFLDGSKMIAGASSIVVSAPKLLLALPVTLKACRNGILGSDTLLKLTHLSLHSTSSQTHLEASTD